MQYFFILKITQKRDFFFNLNGLFNQILSLFRIRDMANDPKNINPFGFKLFYGLIYVIL